MARKGKIGECSLHRQSYFPKYIFHFKSHCFTFLFIVWVPLCYRFGCKKWSIFTSPRSRWSEPLSQPVAIYYSCYLIAVSRMPARLCGYSWVAGCDSSASKRSNKYLIMSPLNKLQISFEYWIKSLYITILSNTLFCKS